MPADRSVSASTGLRPLLDPLDTRDVYSTGKGGVGKTSTACATVVAPADAGRRVLLVSTDPASNLAEVLGTTVGNNPTPVAGAPGLDALDVDPEQAAGAYRERVIGPYRGVLPDSAVASRRGAALRRLHRRDRRVRRVHRPARRRLDRRPRPRRVRHRHDRPHPAAARRHPQLPPRARPADRQTPDDAVHLLDRLRDPARTHVLLVALPEATPVHEATRLQADLLRSGIRPTAWQPEPARRRPRRPAAAGPGEPGGAAPGGGDRRPRPADRRARPSARGTRRRRRAPRADGRARAPGLAAAAGEGQ